jgi:hypothetical protein
VWDNIPHVSSLSRPYRTKGVCGAVQPSMSASPSATVLSQVLQVLRPVVRLLVHHGVTYPALAAALKRVFIEEAQRELQRRGMATTHSAVTLLSGVHRRDVRTLTRETQAQAVALADTAAGSDGVAKAAPSQSTQAPTPPPSLAAEVVGVWMHQHRYLDAEGHPRVLPRGANQVGSFDELVHRVSQDIRPRAVLDELLRLGVAAEGEDGVRLLAEGFAPRQGFEDLAALFAANLHDHAAAAVANLRGEANFLEQAVFVDEIGEDSVRELAQASAAAWKQAMRPVMAKAHERFDADQTRPATERRQRARFGIYFYSESTE